MKKVKDNEFYNLIIDFWLSSNILQIDDSLTSQNKTFIENKEERDQFVNKLEKIAEFSVLRQMIYNEELTNNKDAKHDKLTFFTKAYLNTLFWLLEDGPNSLETDISAKFLEEIKIISQRFEKF